MTDWNRVAELLHRKSITDDCDASDCASCWAAQQAISLCLRMARGELVERSEYAKGRDEQWRLLGELGVKQPPPAPAPARWEDEYHGNDVDRLKTEFRERLRKDAPAPAVGHSTSLVQKMFDPRTKAPAPAQDEREHCERQARRFFDYQHEQDGHLYGLPSMFISERAAVRAECEALIASAHEAADIATENYDKVAAEVQALKREVERRDDIILELRGGRAADNAELERLKARVRELEASEKRLQRQAGRVYQLVTSARVLSDYLHEREEDGPFPAGIANALTDLDNSLAGRSTHE